MKPKTIKIVYWVITVLFILFMLFGAVSELMQTEQSKEIIKHLGYPVYLNTILGVAKILGGIAILQWTFKAVKEWAYAGYTIDITGAAASFYFSGDGIGTVLFTLAFMIPLFISYFLWKKVEKLQNFK